MRGLFEELDRQTTPMGEISLRRRLHSGGVFDVEVYEAKLDDEFLMSSLFTVVEIALADLGLAEVGGDGLDVVVGGLGLGYTAQAVLADRRVRSLHVVEALGEVIGWHRADLLPTSGALLGDPRCHLEAADYFACTADGRPYGEGAPDPVDAVLVDIDHSPRWVLHPSHQAFYEPDGLRRLLPRLRPGGVFGLWSDAPPDDTFLAALAEVFASPRAEVVPFANPYTGGESTNTVYLATAP